MSILNTLSSVLTAMPGNQMQVSLNSAVTSGTIPYGDQGPIAAALNDINGSLQASPPAIGTDPTTMQSRVDGLVDQEAANGRLTTQQATELKQLFAANAPGAGTSGATAAFGSTDPFASSSTATGTAGDGLSSTLQSVVDFARNLRLAIKGQSPYGITGAPTGGTTPAGMLVSGLA